MHSTQGTLAAGGPGTPVTGANGAAGDGADDGPPIGTEPVGRGYEPMSVRGPALIVLGLAVFLLIGGVVASAISSGSNPSFTIRHVTLSDSTVVDLAPASVKLHAIVSNDEPPADVIGKLGVPTESVVTGVVSNDRNTAQFDRTVSLRSQLAQGQVIEAYVQLLKAVGWQTVYNGPAPQGAAGSTEVLAKRGSGDGFYWETGVVVSPTTPSGVTTYSIEVLETPDGN